VSEQRKQETGNNMATISVARPELQIELEDPLDHLPFSNPLEYRKGRMIYSQEQPSTSLYLVVEGKVKVSRLADDGHQVVLDIYQADDFFGDAKRERRHRDRGRRRIECRLQA